MVEDRPEKGWTLRRRGSIVCSDCLSDVRCCCELYIPSKVSGISSHLESIKKGNFDHRTLQGAAGQCRRTLS